MKEAETVWLAADPDREGEAIAWHVAELIKAEARPPSASRSTRSPSVPSRRRSKIPA